MNPLLKPKTTLFLALVIFCLRPFVGYCPCSTPILVYKAIAHLFVGAMWMGYFVYDNEATARGTRMSSVITDPRRISSRWYGGIAITLTLWEGANALPALYRAVFQ